MDAKQSTFEKVHKKGTSVEVKAPVKVPVAKFERLKELDLENPAVDLLSRNVEKDTLAFISEHVQVNRKHTAILSTTTKFNVENIKQKINGVVYPTNLINLKKINNIQDINEFLGSVNSKLPSHGHFIGCFESKNQRKQRILKKYPLAINWIYYLFDFIFKRVFPKIPVLRKLYFFVTAGRNQVLTQVETFGRLYYAGFKLVDHRRINNKIYFVAKKKKDPSWDVKPTYGPLCALQRNGQNGKPIQVYKIRTMHAYSEFLQEYVYEKNSLQDGGKFKNDFRISNIGKFLRVYWLDELPMLFNLLKGEMKLVGVRPLSNHYLSLYSEELREIRKNHKPGLIPPFYADLPKTLEEIMASEMKYLRSYEKNPALTDIKYLFKILTNILIKKARSN
ncbi:MAG: sugar transferase [Candidatus Cyclobacteriaceae bacterium M3_2C_046]